MSDQSTESKETQMWQARAIGEVITAIARGDFMHEVPLQAPVGMTWDSEQLEVAKTLNGLVDHLNQFASEATRISREVGTEGRFEPQMEVEGEAGTWKDLTDNINSMAYSLTNQVRDLASVTTSIANGDLSRKVTVGAQGEIGELKDTINVMIDQLNSFASQMTRLSREIGTEGELGGQIEVKGVSGIWADMTDNLNIMSANLTTQVRGISKVVTAAANGDLTLKLVIESKGEIAALADTINSMNDMLSIFASEVTTVAREMGTEGRLGVQAEVPNATGTWKDLINNINIMAENLTAQVRTMSMFVTFIANGNFDNVIVVESKGEVAALKDKMNSLTEMLSIFASEVTTVVREMGTEGRLGVQADVPNADGTWKDLIGNVNFMSNNLTVQIRSLSDAARAAIDGDTSRRVTVEAQGEMVELRDAVNILIERSGRAS